MLCPSFLRHTPHKGQTGQVEKTLPGGRLVIAKIIFSPNPRGAAPASITFLFLLEGWLIGANYRISDGSVLGITCFLDFSPDFS